MRKSTVKKAAKKTSGKAMPVHHLKPIDDLLDCMETCEQKLNHLLNTIPEKLEKLVTSVKSKLTKTIEQHKKANLTLKNVHAKHKAKPSKLTQAAVKKSEQVVVGIAAMVASIKEELTALQTQLATCKDMKKFLNTAEKSSVKKTATKKPMAKRTKKVVLESPDVIALEHF